MTWWRVGSRAATAARSATVFPAPTSPVTTPSADSTTQKLIRAIASACAGRAIGHHGAVGARELAVPGSAGPAPGDPAVGSYPASGGGSASPFPLARLGSN